MSEFEDRVLGLLTGMGQRLDAMDRRFDAMDKRFDAVDRRFDAIVARLDAQDEAIDLIIEKLDRNSMMIREAMQSSEQALSTNIRISQRMARLENPDADGDAA